MSEKLLNDLSSFDANLRQEALNELKCMHPERPETNTYINMHLHTFFSYNGEGYSPARIAWEARQQRLHAAAICDFDVLDGLEEFQSACEQLGVRHMCGFETRTFFTEYADATINSPGEPGVFYFMGTGFIKMPPQDSLAGEGFKKLIRLSHQRNEALVERINNELDGMSVNYRSEVMPLTPNGNATERHIIRAYYDKSLQVFGNASSAAAFWAKTFGKSEEELKPVMKNPNKATDMLRSALVKGGGVAYQQPGPDAFPVLDEVIAIVRDQRAIPTSAWLDGTSAGESKPEEQLELLMSKGVEAVNIIPDRNWNIKDETQKAQKIAQLGKYTGAAKALGLPINVGTECNKPGQRFVDDFTSEPLKSLLPDYLEGAQIMVGHARLLRFADLSYIDSKTVDLYPDRKRRNKAFAAVGALPEPDRAIREKLLELGAEKALDYIMAAAEAGTWN